MTAVGSGRSDLIRNNADRVEKTHSVSSLLVQKSGCRISSDLVSPLVMAKDNEVFGYLLKLFSGGDAQRKIVQWILERADQVNMTADRKMKVEERSEHAALRQAYLGKHMNQICLIPLRGSRATCY